MGEGKPSEFYGRVLPYMSWSRAPLYDDYYERFHPDAFKGWLADKPNVYACVEHDRSKYLGSTDAGTLRLENRSDGLYAFCINNETTPANDLAKLIKTGDVKGMSFRFGYGDVEPSKHQDRNAITVMTARLREVCFTTSPAYLETDASMRSTFADDSTDKVAARLRKVRLLSLGN